MAGYSPKLVEPYTTLYSAALMPQQSLGEQAALLDLDGDGFKELFLFPAATRSYADPMQQPVAIFGLSSTFKLEPRFNLVNRDGKTIIDQSSSNLAYARNLTTGWLQEAIVADFDSDGLSDLLLAGHGRELPVTEAEAANSNGLYRAGFWPNDFLQVILSTNPSKPIYLPERKTAFWHSAGIGDLNGDGYLDIVAANLATYKHRPVEILLGNGNGSFRAASIDNPLFWTPSAGNDPLAFVVAIADIGRFAPTGKDSLVVGRGQAKSGSEWEYTHILILDYHETSLSIREALVLDLSAEDLSSIDASEKDIWLDQIVIGDVNNDSKDDIFGKFVSLDWEYVATVAFISSEAGYKQNIVDVNDHSSKNNFGGKGPTLYDVNGDGYLDIVTGDFIFKGEANALMSSFIFLGDGTGRFVQLSKIWQPLKSDNFRNINWFKAVEDDGNVLFAVRQVDGLLAQISLIELNNLPTIEHVRNYLASPSDNVGEMINGTDLIDTLRGSEKNDIMKSFSGRDIIYAGQGNDTIDGGDGIDFLIFQGLHSDYLITLDTVSDKMIERDGTDVISNVERFRFSDKIVALDIDGNAGQAYRLYKAALDRVPDEQGLADWVNYLDNGGLLNAVSQMFIDSAEFRAKYGALDDYNFVNQLYRNVLDRDGETQGVNDWVGALSGGAKTRAEVLVGFSESQENQDNVIGAIKNGIPYTEYWLL